MGLGYRAKYLSRLPRLVQSEGPDLLSLRAVPYQAAREALLALPGVGEKVADCVLAFSLDQGKAFPVDVWVRRAVREWYYRGRRVTDRRIRLWAARRFGDDAAYAQQYLFHYRRLLHRTAHNAG
jgi:N-glycosylase/DNA lyase